LKLLFLFRENEKTVIQSFDIGLSFSHQSSGVDCVGLGW
jgi:hypothetical protein